MRTWHKWNIMAPGVTRGEVLANINFCFGLSLGLFAGKYVDTSETGGEHSLLKAWRPTAPQVTNDLSVCRR